MTLLSGYADTQARILAEPLWVMNFGFVKKQLESIPIIPDISGMRVEEYDTGFVIQGGLLPDNDTFDQFFMVSGKYYLVGNVFGFSVYYAVVVILGHEVARGGVSVGKGQDQAVVR